MADTETRVDYYPCPECAYVYEVLDCGEGKIFASGMEPCDEDELYYYFDPSNHSDCSTKLLVRKNRP